MNVFHPVLKTIAAHNRRILDQQPQNKPSQIVRDLADVGVNPIVSYEILLRRGVFKWFAARRDIIKLKDRLKGKIRDANKEIANLKALAKFHQQERLRLQRAAASDGVTIEGRTEAWASHINKFHQVVARRHYMRGYLKGLEEARAEIRAIAHSPRWRAQDNDAAAAKWLELYEQGVPWDQDLWDAEPVKEAIPA
jgi:hypothetical protein